MAGVAGGHTRRRAGVGRRVHQAEGADDGDQRHDQGDDGPERAARTTCASARWPSNGCVRWSATTTPRHHLVADIASRGAAIRREQ